MIQARVHLEGRRVVEIVAVLVEVVELRDAVRGLEGVHQVLARLQEVAAAGQFGRPDETVADIGAALHRIVIVGVLDGADALPYWCAALP